MKAVVLNGVTPAGQVVLSETEIPKVRPGWVLVRVRAFGMNHSEQILRLHEIEADYIEKPVIPGIECVGEIIDASDSGLSAGQRIVALMGGMGRSFNGSYAEYVLLPTHHVFPVQTWLSWKELAAVPETYFTAWGSLFECLDLKLSDTLLVRDGTCALGYAAIQIAKAFGCRVIATTHRQEKLSLLAGVDEAVLDNGKLEGKLHGVTKALELVGPKTLSDTLRCVEKGGIVCNTGILGGIYALNSFDPIKFIPNGVYLTGFHSNWPTQKVMDAKTCLQKLQYVGVLAFATVDREGNPQVRNISAIHYEPDGIYFFTARGKDFCRELLEDGRVQILGYTRYKEMIRLSARAVPAADGEQKMWIDTIFEEQPYLSNVYPGNTRSIGIVFEMKDAVIEYFHLGVNPIFREVYAIGNGTVRAKGYQITEDCIGCGKCARNCPQRCIMEGEPFVIRQEHCLHCGNCYENCPVKAVRRRG